MEVLLEVELADAQQHIPLGSAVLEVCDGGVLMRLYSTDLTVTARYLCWLDCAFVIRRPQELRTAVQALAGTVIANANRMQ